jgi:hypothetical protein
MLAGSLNGVRKSLEMRAGVPPLPAALESSATSDVAGAVIGRASIATLASVFTLPSFPVLLFVFARHAGAASKIVSRELRTSAAPRRLVPRLLARIGPRRSVLLVCLRENILQAV